MKADQQSPHFPDCFYRATVKGLFVKDGKLMLVKEPATLSGKWELPGGGLDFGENVYSALKREYMEETGLEVIAMEKRPQYVWPWKMTNRRNMEWWYTMVLAYRVDLANLNFKKTDECEDIGFFSQEELKNIEMATGGIQDLFDPKDFEVPIIDYQS